MTTLQRHGGWMLLVFGVALGVYGLVEERDVVVLAGALLTACGVVVDRIGGPRRASVGSAMSAQLREDVEQRVAERLRRARDN